MSRSPNITIDAAGLRVDVWRRDSSLDASACLHGAEDAHALEIEGGGMVDRPFSALVLTARDGAKVSIHLPPGVATRMAAAFHGPAPDRTAAVAAALDRVDRESVVSGAMTETPTRALMELRKALDPARWAYATAGEAAE